MNRAFYAARQDRARSLDGVDAEVAHASREALAAQRSELIEAQRQAVITLWRAGTITDQTLADAEREIDLNLRRDCQWVGVTGKPPGAAQGWTRSCVFHLPEPEITGTLDGLSAGKQAICQPAWPIHWIRR